MWPAQPVQGYAVDYRFADGEARKFAHAFCGAHDVRGAVCPGSSRPLLLLLTLDTSDPRLGLSGHQPELLRLFYTWNCDAMAAQLAYHVAMDGSLTVVGIQGVSEGPLDLNGQEPYPQAPARLIPLESDEQRLLVEINAGDRFDYDLDERYSFLGSPFHQVGGEPYLVQKNPGHRGKCPTCHATAPFLAAVADDNPHDDGFVGNEFVQVLFFYCRACRVVIAWNQCD
jgi:hypothetical protein